MDAGKTIRWTLTGIAAALMVIFFAGLALTRSAAFHRYLLGKIIQQAQESTGARVEVRSMDLRWSPLRADFYGVVVHGAEKSAQPALLTADHLGVSLGVAELLHHSVDLYTLVLDRPVVHVLVSEDGRNNLPQAPHAAAQSSSNTKMLVRHAAIRDGLVNYNDQQIPLSADLDNFYATADFNPIANKYTGSLGYRQGIVTAKDMNAFAHQTQINFVADSRTFVLSRLQIDGRGSRIMAHATLSDYAHPVVDGAYEGLIATAELARTLKNPEIPAGEVSLRGKFSYQDQAGHPFLLGLRVIGEISSPALLLRNEQASMALTRVHGEYAVRDANLSVSKLQANVLDGTLSGSYTMKNLDKKTSASQVKAQLAGLSLAKLSDALPANTRRNARLIGRLSGNLEASWSGSIQKAVAHSHLEIRGPLTPTQQGTDITVNAIVNVDYDGARERASFGQSQIRTAKTQLTLSGTLSRQSHLQVEADARDLHELNALLSSLSAANRRPDEPAPAVYEVRGAAHFSGQLSGAPSDPRLQGQLSSSGLQVQTSRWRNLRADLDLSSSRFALQNLSLENEQKGQIHLSARTDLEHWSFTPHSPLALRGQITNFAVADVQQLGKLNYPVSGQLSANFSLDGSEEHPNGNGRLELAKGSAWGEPINAFTVEFRAVNDSVDSKTHLAVNAGAIDVQLKYAPKTQNYEAELDANSLKLERVQSLQQRAGGLAGTLTATLHGQGTLKDPQLSASIKSPKLTVSGEKISELDAQLNVARQHAEFDLKSTVEQGYVRAKGGIDLQGEYSSNATADVRALPLRPALARFLPAVARELKGETDIHASLKGPLKNPQRLEATLEVPTIQAEYKNFQIGNDGPIRVAYRTGVVTVEKAAIKGTGANLNVHGVVPLQGGSPMNLSAKGDVDLAIIQAVSSNTEASGKIDMDVQASGNLSSPSVQGQVRIANAALSAEALPSALSGVNGEIAISGNRIDIKHIDGAVGGGTISTHGAVVYGQQPTLNVDLQAKSVRIRPDGIRSVLDGNLQLNGTPQHSSLSGQVIVDRLSFQQGFDLAEFLGQFSGTPEVRTPSPFENNMKLNVSVKSAQNLNPSSSQLSMEGSADLNVTGTAADPVILGRIALTRGELFFLNKRFEVDSGTVAFANPVRTEPVVNLFVKTTVEQYNITIHFTGPVEQLKTTYTSEPSLPQVDIINLLAFGQTTAEKASNAATPTSLGAESALAQGVAGQVAKGVQSATGLSQLTIDPLAGNSQNPGAQVAVQQRVTGSILLSFSTDVTSTQRQTVELQYQPKKQIKISVVRDEYGGYGIDVRLHKVF
jgi:translocation and assembly module TamB